MSLFYKASVEYETCKHEKIRTYAIDHACSNLENITVKLNGNELTILATAAEGSTDDFKQTHIVPEGIDMDQMSSSFSADGVLVVKAPRKK